MPPWKGLCQGAEVANRGSRECCQQPLGRSDHGGRVSCAPFIQDGVPWAHFDIAGTTLSGKDLPLAPKGATGWGVRTLDRMIRTRYENT